MLPSLTYYDPVDMLRQAEQEMDRIPSADLFNDPSYQKLTERWCAGMFGAGYAKLITPCEVAVNQSRYREDVDVFMRTAKHVWEFQLAEAQKPGRKRGLEFKQLEAGEVSTIEQDPELGHLEGANWLAASIEKKKSKRYASSQQLHLLVYANFPAQGLLYGNLVDRLKSYQEDFASLWIFTSLHLCSVFSTKELGMLTGWGKIRDIQDYYP